MFSSLVHSDRQKVNPRSRNPATIHLMIIISQTLIDKLSKQQLTVHYEYLFDGAQEERMKSGGLQEESIPSRGITSQSHTTALAKSFIALFIVDLVIATRSHVYSLYCEYN